MKIVVRGGRRGAVSAKSLERLGSISVAGVFSTKSDSRAQMSKKSPEFIKKFLNLCRCLLHLFFLIYLRDSYDSCLYVEFELKVVAGCGRYKL